MEAQRKAMRERINRLARGVLNSEVPVLSVRPENLRLSVRRGEMLSAEFHADSENGIQLKGLAYSDDIRVRVLTESFGGVRNRIRLTADARYLEVGDEIAGRILLVTDGGEKKIEYCFTVTDGQGTELLERLKSTEDFAKVAKTDREAALRIFAYREFRSAPFLRDAERSALYRAFSKSSDTARGMDGFLAALGERPGESFRATAESELLPRTARSGKVFLESGEALLLPIAVEARGDFLRLSQRSIAPEKVLGERFPYLFDIDRNALHEGKNIGELVFTSGDICRTVRLTLVAGAQERRSAAGQNRANEPREGRHMLRYRSAYALFLLSGKREQLGEAEAALREAERDKEVDAQRAALLSAELLAARGNTTRAQQYLALLDGSFSGSVSHSAERQKLVLADSLRSLLSGDEQRKLRATERLERELTRDGDAELLPLLLLLDPNYPEVRAAKWDKLLKLCYRKGSRSIYLYALLAKSLREHKEPLTALGPDTFAALRFLLREQVMTKPLARRVAALATETDSWDRGAMRVLRAVYEKLPQQELLEVFVRGALRRGARDREAYRWYREAVRLDLRIAGLYEALLESMPEDEAEPLPQELLLYFLFDNTLEEESLTKLYKKVCENRENEPGIWREYRREIEDFGLKRLLSGKVSRSLAEIYRALLWPGMIDKRLAAELPCILLTHYVADERAEAHRLIAVYPELEKEEQVDFLRGEAYIPLYSPRVILLTEDSAGNRRAPKALKREALFDLPEYLEQCELLQPEQPAVLLRRLEELLKRAREGAENLDDEAVRSLRYGLEEMPLAESCKREIRAALLANKSRCEAYLQSSDKALFTEAERAEIFALLVQREKWQEAYELVQEYLPRKLDPEALRQLLTQLLRSKKAVADECFTKLALAVFRSGKAGVEILNYLAAHYNGGSAEMRELLHAVEEQGAEVGDLPARLLAEQLFLGDRSELRWIFACCEKQGAVQRELAEAYFTVCAGEYVLSDVPITADQARAMEDYAEQMPKLPELYAYALLKYYVSLESLGSREKKFAERFLQSLSEQDIFLPEAKKLSGSVNLPDSLSERAVFTFRGEEGKRYLIESRVLPGEENFRRADCKKLFGRIYQRSTVLFSGETEEYRVTEAESGEVVQRAVLRESAARTAQGSGYARLNRMGMMLDGEEEGLAAEISAYAAAREARSELFAFDAENTVLTGAQRGADGNAISGD